MLSFAVTPPPSAAHISLVPRRNAGTAPVNDDETTSWSRRAQTARDDEPDPTARRLWLRRRALTATEDDYETTNSVRYDELEATA